MVFAVCFIIPFQFTRKVLQIMDTNQFLGLSKKGAQNLAEAKNMIFQLSTVDGEVFFTPPETQERTDRIYVDIEKGKVVKVLVR